MPGGEEERLSLLLTLAPQVDPPSSRASRTPVISSSLSAPLLVVVLGLVLQPCRSGLMHTENVGASGEKLRKTECIQKSVKVVCLLDGRSHYFAAVSGSKAARCERTPAALPFCVGTPFA
jgi:hypothetical protein